MEDRENPVGLRTENISIMNIVNIIKHRWDNPIIIIERWLEQFRYLTYLYPTLGVFLGGMIFWLSIPVYVVAVGFLSFILTSSIWLGTLVLATIFGIGGMLVTLGVGFAFFGTLGFWSSLIMAAWVYTFLTVYRWCRRALSYLKILNYDETEI